ncbi:MAG: hypothetical protein H0U53_11000 [Actinobacteria bacterium]|nr:hypothetical protein [Actinomycetota bacterium]
MTVVTNENRHTFVPISTSLAVMQRMTTEAMERLDILVESYNAQRAQVYLDGEKMIGFTLFDSRGAAIVVGGIEADGSCHT